MLQADRALFQFCNDQCLEQGGTRKQAGGVATRFEKAWVKGTLDPSVCRHLDQRHSTAQQLPGGATAQHAMAIYIKESSSSAHPAPPTPFQAQGQGDRDYNALKRDLSKMQNENARLKKQAKNSDGGKGGGRNRRDNARDTGPPTAKAGKAPLPEARMRRNSTDSGGTFCFPFKSGKGCSLAEVGGQCRFGHHLCCLCPRDAQHSCTIHWNGRGYSGY